MIRFVKSLFTRAFIREEVMEDVKWLFLLTAAVFFFTGLLLSSQVPSGGIYYLGAGLFFLCAGFLRFFWVQFVILILWTAALVLDFFARGNVFSVFFILTGIYYFYSMLRSRRHRPTDGKDDPPAPPPSNPYEKIYGSQ